MQTSAHTLLTAAFATGALVLAGSASANLFVDGSMSDDPAGGGVDAWGPNGDDFNHSAAPKLYMGNLQTGTGALGDQFAYYSDGNSESVYQITSTTITAGTTYTFDAVLSAGGSPGGTATMFIGATTDPAGPGAAAGTVAAPPAGITVLASVDQAPGSDWGDFQLTWTATSNIGDTLVAGFLDSGSTAGPNDIWLDELSLVPEPATMGLLALGGALAAGRRRR